MHEIFSQGWQWANEQLIKFWWRARSVSEYVDCFLDIREVVNGHVFTLIRQMATLVRRALVEVCTVQMLLVSSVSMSGNNN